MSEGDQIVEGMPWKATDAMKEKTKFVLEWERRWQETEGHVNVSELCRTFGISREAGHKWIKRYIDGGSKIEAVAERSRRPLTSPTATPIEIEDMIVALRKQRPTWGPRKIHRKLIDTKPGLPIPSASLIAKVLKKRGLTTPRRRRTNRPAFGVVAPFSHCDAPNAVWCIDFKGWFLTGDGVRCTPLTLIDAYSRYLLRCEVVDDPDTRDVQRILDSAFQEFGLPLAIRSDGGPPFASTGPAKLTRLSVWILRLGVRVEIIAPAKPQQNGRLERFHRTLHAETASPPRSNAIAQQRLFDTWRHDYNVERPHEALKMRCPTEAYTPSPRRYPRPLIRPNLDPFSGVGNVDRNGFISWCRRKVFISSALRHEQVELHQDGERYWNVRWGAIPLGRLDQENLSRGLQFVRRPRGVAKTTVLSLL